ISSGVNIAPFGFLPGGLLLAWGLYHYRAWDIHTLADRSILANIQDALITLDIDLHIVDTNPAARILFPQALAGQAAQDILPPDWLVNFAPAQERQIEVTRSVGQKLATYDLRFLPVYGRFQ
ncbi:hypothetical protein ACFLYO_10075, partial [Chloroflexota bacterium]